MGRCWLGLIMKQLFLLFSLMLLAVGAKAANVAYNTSTLNVTPTNLNYLRASNITVVGNLYAATNNNNTYFLLGEVEAGIVEMGLPYDGFKFGIFETPKPAGSDIDIIWTAFSPNNSAAHEFFTIARTNDNNTYTFYEVRARRNGTGSTLTMRAQATTNNNDARTTIEGSTSDTTASVRSAFDLRTFGSAGAIGNAGGEAMFLLRTVLPNITNALFVDFKTNNVSVFSISDLGAVSARSLSITNALKVGPANQATITNILSGSATLNFASQSVGGSEDLAITVTGAKDGDAVSLGYESAVATGIIGSFSAWASNGVVFVRFIATAATQNPPSGVFRVVVTEF